MVKLIITFAVWAGLSYPIYKYIGPVAVCLYGFVSMVVFLVWAVTRKK